MKFAQLTMEQRFSRNSNTAIVAAFVKELKLYKPSLYCSRITTVNMEPVSEYNTCKAVSKPLTAGGALFLTSNGSSYLDVSCQNVMCRYKNRPRRYKEDTIHVRI